jgi:large subunit ribosomal protein L9
MKVILLERIERLGQMGDVVKVKPGFARNYLLPQKKALRATDENRTHFEGQRVQLEATNFKHREEAKAIASKVEGQLFVIIRQAGDEGHLYGSVTARDIAEALIEGGFTIIRQQVLLEQNIKLLGLYECRVALHSEVIVTVSINVARSEEEAKAQAAGESLVTETKKTLGEQTSLEQISLEQAPQKEVEVEPKAKKKKKAAKAAKKENGETGAAREAGDNEEGEAPSDVSSDNSPAKTSVEEQEAKKEDADLNPQ